MQFVGFNESPAHTEAYVLDTQTNAVVKTFIPTVPVGYAAESVSPPGNLALFAPDGQSIWVDLGCPPGTTCSLDNGATEVLAKFAFASGALLAHTGLANEPEAGYHVSLAFPLVLKLPAQ